MPDRGDQPGDVAVVKTGGGVTEIDGNAASEAGGQQQDAPFPAFSELPAVPVTC